MCQKRAIFKPMTEVERIDLKERCGGSWKLVLRFLLAGEACSRREKSQAIAGPGHSIAVTSNGAVFSFGSNSSGQLGHGTMEEEWQPRQIRSLSLCNHRVDNVEAKMKLIHKQKWFTENLCGMMCQWYLSKLRETTVGWVGV